MVKPVDISKFRKTLTKNIPGLSIGFNDPKTWISFGNKSLNYLVSGDFNKGIALGKVSILAGESGSGKSLLTANVIKNAQDMGIFVILIDTENALDESWLKEFNVDTSLEKLLKLNMAMVDDVARTISEYVKEYREIPEDERSEILFVIDSLGMLLVEAQTAQFERGELKGDFGHKPKALKALITNCVNMFGNLGIGMLCTNHTYTSQDIFSPDDVVSGGCLVENTMVLMDNNEFKEIQNISIGDIVRTCNGGNQVVNTWEYERPTYNLILSNGKEIKCSPEHKFLILRNNKEEWISAEDLLDGDTFVLKL